jgi:hypothetical protein
MAIEAAKFPRPRRGEGGIWWAGVSSGLFNDILSAVAWVSRIASDAEKIIRE